MGIVNDYNCRYLGGVAGNAGLFSNYKTSFYVVILSNATVQTVKKYGYEDYEKVMKMRKRIHSAIAKDLL